MATRATEGQSKKHGAGGGHAIDDVIDAILLKVDAALEVDRRVAMEAGGNQLVRGGLGQQIARKLIHGELVEGHVEVEGVDHPIAIFPNFAGRINGIAIRIGIASLVEPVPSPALAVVGRGEQTVHLPFVGAGLRIGQEGGEFGRGRRQSCQVEAHAAQERTPIGGLRHGEPGVGQLYADEVIHRMRARRNEGFLGRLKTPMHGCRSHFGGHGQAVRHPLFEHGNLGVFQLAAWWHLDGPGVTNHVQQQTALARLHRRPVLTTFEDAFACVESQATHGRLRAVAAQTGSEDRSSFGTV